MALDDKKPQADKQSEENKGGQKNSKPTSNTSSQPMPDEYSNEANHKGATDLGTDGTGPTASQQQGQGSWAAKGNSGRIGTDSESGNEGDQESEEK